MSKEIVEVCIVRTTLNLECRMCKYNGDECKEFCNKNNIEKPKDWVQGGKNDY